MPKRSPDSPPRTPAPPAEEPPVLTLDAEIPAPISIEDGMTSEQLMDAISSYRSALNDRANEVNLLPGRSDERRNFAVAIEQAIDFARGIDAAPEEERHDLREQLKGLLLPINTRLTSEYLRVIGQQQERHAAEVAAGWTIGEERGRNVETIAETIAQIEEITASKRPDTIESVVVGADPLATAATPSGPQPFKLGQSGKAQAVSKIESGVAATPQNPEVPPTAVSAEQLAAEQAEKVYLEAYTNFYRTKGVTKADEPAELKALEMDFAAKRLAQIQVLTELAEQRLQGRERKTHEKIVTQGVDEQGRQWETRQSITLSADRVAERYRRFQTFKNVIKPASELKYQARLEAAAAHDRTLVEKFANAGTWLMRKNQEFEAWAGSKHKARLYRASIVAAMVAVPAVATGAIAGLGALAIFGVGRVAKSMVLGTAIGAGAGAVGAGSAEVYGATLGAARINSARTQSLDTLNEGSSSAEALLAAIAARGFVDDETRAVERMKGIVRAVTTLGTGVILGGAVAAAESLGSSSSDSTPMSAPTDATVRNSASIPQATAPEAVIQQPEAPVVVDAIAPAPAQENPVVVETGVTPVLEASSTTQSLDRVITTIAPGQGTDTAFANLKGMLGASTIGAGEQSAVVKMLMEKDPNAISRMMDDYGSRGIVTQPGDAFYLDDKENLMFKPANGEAQMFLKNNPSMPDGVERLELAGKPLPEPTVMTPKAVTVPEATTPTPTPAAIAEQEVKTVTEPAEAQPANESKVEIAQPAETPSEQPPAAPAPEAVSSPTEESVAEASAAVATVDAVAENTPSATQQPEATVAAAEVIMSKNGTPINLSAPAIYDSGKSEAMVALGGTSQQRLDSIYELAKNPENQGMRIVSEGKPHWLTGRPTYREFVIGANGQVAAGPALKLDSELTRLLDTQNITKKIS